MSTHTREPMRDSAFAWATEQIPKFVYACNRRRVSNTSHIEYHVMVDGIVWTDEFPEVTSDLRTTMQKSLCVLIHLRTSVILGEHLTETSNQLRDLLRTSCPEWSFMNEDRWHSERARDYDEVRSRFFKKIDRMIDAINP
jgi:hypothetical protein